MGDHHGAYNMPVLPDGRLQIKNKVTGETKIISPEEAQMYGIQMPQAPVAPQATPVVQAPPPVQPSPVVPPQQPQTSLTENVGNVAINILKGLAKPVVGSMKTIGGAGYELQKKAKESVPSMYPDLPEKNPFLSEEDLMKYSNNPEQALREQLGRSVQLGSYAIPFGKGANIVTQAVLPGAASGGIAEAGRQLEEGKMNPAKIAGSAVIGGGSSALAYGAGKVVEKIAQKIGKGVQGVGEKTIQSQYNLPRSVAKDTKLPETVHRLNEMGLRRIDDVFDAADVVTGSDGVVTKMTRKAVAGAQPVQMTGVTSVADDLALNPDIPLGQDKKFVEFVTQKIKNIKTDIGNNADPSDVYDLIQALEKQAYSYGGKSIQLTSADKAMRSAYLTIADELKDRLFIQSGADDLISGIVQSDMLSKVAQKYPKVAEAIMNAKTVGELRNVAEPLVKGSIAGEVTREGANLATQTMGGAVQGVGRLVQNPLNLLAIPLSSNTVNAGAGGAMAGAGKAIESVSKQLPQIAGQVGARLPSASFQDVTEESQNQNQPNETGVQNYQPGNNMNRQINHVSDYKTMGQQDQLASPTEKGLPPITGFSVEQLGQGYTKALMAGDKAAAAQLKTLYDMESQYQKSKKPKAISSEMAKNQGLASSGMRGIEEVDRLLKEDPNLLATSFLTRGLATRKYENAAFRAAEGILRMRTGAVVSPKEAENYAKKFLPWFGDQPEDIAYKLEQARKDYEDLNRLFNAEDVAVDPGLPPIEQSPLGM